MQASKRGEYLPDQNLPSLRPMLHSAKMSGAFQFRDPTEITKEDVRLQNLDAKYHPDRTRFIREGDPTDERRKSWGSGSGSNSSTTCESQGGATATTCPTTVTGTGDDSSDRQSRSGRQPSQPG